MFTSRIDVFFCTIPGRDTAKVCEDMWLDLGVNFIPMNPAALGCTNHEFQRDRRLFADITASGPYYIVADDDCLPPSGPWMRDAEKIMERHKDFAILSLWPENASIQRWTPEDYRPYEDMEVMEHISVGNIRLCRKNVIRVNDWPPMPTGYHYDHTHCEAIRKAGYRSGYFKEIRMIHLGEGKTSLPSESHC